MSITATHVHASPRNTLAGSAGVCTVVGSVAETFSPAVGLAPAAVRATLSGSASCAGVPLTNTVTIDLTTNALLSCAGGEGTFAGDFAFSSGFPPAVLTTGLYVGAPGSEVFEVTGQGLTVVGALAWSPTATATCPLSGTASTPLYGTLAYVYD